MRGTVHRVSEPVRKGLVVTNATRARVISRYALPTPWLLRSREDTLTPWRQNWFTPLTSSRGPEPAGRYRSRHNRWRRPVTKRPAKPPTSLSTVTPGPSSSPSSAQSPERPQGSRVYRRAGRQE